MTQGHDDAAPLVMGRAVPAVSAPADDRLSRIEAAIQFLLEEVRRLRELLAEDGK